MAETFAITTPNTTVALDLGRHGHVDFTVSNASGRKLRARAKVITPNPTVAPWLTLVGDAEREFPRAGTEVYTVQIAAPPEAPAGSYLFNLDVVGLDVPEEQLSHGPSVTFQVSELGRLHWTFPWWIPVAVGVLMLVVVGIGISFAVRNPGLGCVPPPPGPWSIAAAIPAAVGSTAGLISDGTYAYAVGGFAGGNPGRMSPQFVRYDPRIDAWSLLPDVPTPAEGISFVDLGGQFYAFGGSAADSNGLVAVRIYNPETRAWTSGPPLPGPRGHMASGVYGGKAYLVGGETTWNGAAREAQTWSFDPATNIWSILAAMPAERTRPGYGVINGHLYVVGGSDNTAAPVNTTFDYDIAHNTWTTLSQAPLPIAVWEPGSAVVNAQLWIIGGHGHGTEPAQVTQIFDPSTATWSQGPPLASGRWGLAGARIGTAVLAVGGLLPSGPLATNDRSNTATCPGG